MRMIMNEDQAHCALLEHLRQIKCDNVRARSMNAIVSILRTCNFSCETLQQLVSSNAVEMIVEAMELDQFSAPAKFLQDGIVSIHLIIKDSQERTTLLLNSIGLDIFLELMGIQNMDDNDNILLSILIFALFAGIARNVDRQASWIARYSAQIVTIAVDFMEEHCESAKAFHATSSVLLAWGPPGEEDTDRLIQNVWYGISRHADNMHAQQVGLRLLRRLFGPHTNRSNCHSVQR